MAVKTIEFKIHPSADVVDKWEYQLDALRCVWNRGLSLLIEQEQRNWLAKAGRADANGCVLRCKPRKVKGKPVTFRLVAKGIVRPKAYRENPETAKVGPFCATRQHREVEHIKTQKEPKVTGALNKCNSISQYPWLDKSVVDSRFIGGVFQSLNRSWKAYKDPQHPGKKPRFKGRDNVLKSLVNESGSVKFCPRADGPDNAIASFPKGVTVPVRKFYSRIGDHRYGTVRVCRKASGWYLQVTTKKFKAKQLKPSTKEVGIDPGVKSTITTDQGKSYGIQKHAQQLRKLKRLQRKAARQYRQNGKSKGWAKTQKVIALVWERIARSRNAWQHKMSTKLVSEFGHIAIENTQLGNMTRKSKPKKSEDGKGYEKNGAKAKSGLNKAILSSGIGGLKAKLEDKANSHGRTFSAVPAAHTSATCNQCGYVHTKAEKKAYRPTQAKFVCQGCGHTANADENAAKNILDKSKIDVA